jgi:hypothetical protein
MKTLEQWFEGMVSHKNVTNNKDSLPLCSSNILFRYWFMTILVKFIALLQQYIHICYLGILVLLLVFLFSIIIKMGIQMTVLLAFAL